MINGIPNSISRYICSGSFNKRGMKEIKLSRGKVALVDDEDFDYLNQWKWTAHKKKLTYYAVKYGNMKNGIQQHKRMHRIIMKTPDDMFVDHIDHNGLNNQKANLRNCYKWQNQRNSKGYAKNHKYKGYTIDKCGFYVGSITLHNFKCFHRPELVL
jgi:hypothetical protein